jgi:hypothetical protein
MGQNLGHRGAKFARTGSHGQAEGFHNFRLLGGAVAACRNDRAGMAHAAAFWRGEARDIADHRFGHVTLDPRRRLGFLGPANFADHHDRGGFRIALEQHQMVQERAAIDRIAANADARPVDRAVEADIVEVMLGGLDLARVLII